MESLCQMVNPPMSRGGGDLSGFDPKDLQEMGERFDQIVSDEKKGLTTFEGSAHDGRILSDEEFMAWLLNTGMTVGDKVVAPSGNILQVPQE